MYKGFSVLVDGRPTYGGVVLEPMSQLAIRFPVLRFDTRNGKTVLSLMPVHWPLFFTSDPVLMLLPAITSPYSTRHGAIGGSFHR